MSSATVHPEEFFQKTGNRNSLSRKSDDAPETQTAEQSRLSKADADTARKSTSIYDKAKERMAHRGEEAFKRLKKMFLGAINTLDEDSIKEILVENQSLIDSGFLDVNAPIKDTRSTLLHTAVWYRKIDLVKFLLAHGADPNAANIKGNTPLHFACEHADKEKGREVISMLLAAGGDAMRKNYDRQLTPMDHATSLGCQHFVEAESAKAADLRSAGVVSAWREQATQEVKVRKASIAPSKNTDLAPPTLNKERRRASIAALENMASALTGEKPRIIDPKLQSRAQSVFEELKKQFGSILQTDDASVRAVLQGSEDLLTLGYLNVNSPISNTKSTLLHTAVWYRRPNLVRWLLDSGADPNVVNMKGNSPLHFACENAEKSFGKEIVDMLLEAGGDIYLKNLTQNKTPFEKAPESFRQYLMSWNQSNEADPAASPPQQEQQEKESDQAQAQTLLQFAEKEAEQLNIAIIKDKVDQDEALKAKLARGKEKSKATKIIDTAFKETEALSKVLKDQEKAQDDAWIAKLKQKAEVKAEAPELFSPEPFEQPINRLEHDSQPFESMVQQNGVLDGGEPLEDTLGILPLFSSLDDAAKGQLSLETIMNLHKELHCCDIPRAVVATVHQAAGVVTVNNFLAVMQSLHIACRRHETLYWDFQCLDADKTGFLSTAFGGPAEMLWNVNMEPDHHPNYRDYATARTQTVQTVENDEVHRGMTFEEVRQTLLF